MGEKQISDVMSLTHAVVSLLSERNRCAPVTDNAQRADEVLGLMFNRLKEALVSPEKNAEI